MNDMLIGINNFVDWFSNIWFILIVIIGCSMCVYRIKKSLDGLTKEEKWDLIQDQISEIILKLITDAEEDYKEWVKAGSIKRSQVIKQIYEQFPILTELVNQEEIIQWIDLQIDNALITLRNIIENNKEDVK